MSSQTKRLGQIFYWIATTVSAVILIPLAAFPVVVLFRNLTVPTEAALMLAMAAGLAVLLYGLGLFVRWLLSG